ncbi:hypothetical protein [Marinomonas profundimaris]|uniref:ABC transporter substrate-binding protein n=1 Tax=Marinomonas profundimaris TaxID=1208321 RepID=W1RV63_9GAMM|nr:hypothetical protein [Marinomonas profundimaris]ETI58733.1 hypothetical protein D104_14225 [Marinomonas profundimaris]
MQRFFLLIFLLLASLKVPAAIYVIHDTEESSVRSLTFQLSKLLTIKKPLIPVRSTLFVQNINVLKHDDVMVTVGAESFRKVCSVAAVGAVMAVFIGQEEYLKIKPQCAMPVSGVFSGAPLATRLNLLQAVWFDRKPLAVIYSDHLFVNEEDMMAQADQYGFVFQFIKTQTDRLSVLRSINFILEDSALIVSLVDSELYKNGNAQDILRLLFHKQQVMIGPSLAFVRSGSLFAIYSDNDAKLQSLAERLTAWETKGILLDAVYPDRLRVSFNPYLIKSHGIVLPSSSYLKDRFGLCSDTICD